MRDIIISTDPNTNVTVVEKISGSEFRRDFIKALSAGR